ncbi:hypothetical protein CQA70_29350, partial [Klebsiella pneumoniae]
KEQAERAAAQSEPEILHSDLSALLLELLQWGCQRAGRAGRLSPGICLHLLGKEQAERAAAQSEPEILHSDLSALLLELLQWGC